jgi:acyl dehydratase
MESAALDLAFNQLNLRKLNCEVLDFNQTVISLHKKFGFKVEGVFKKQYRRENNFHDIYRLALNRDDWERMKSPVEFIFPELIKVRTAKEFAIKFSESETNNFAMLCGDTNPIHLDRGAAKLAGFSSQVVHGALIMARLSRHLAVDFPGPGTIIVEQIAKFIKPTYVDTEVNLRVMVNQIIGNRILLSFTFSDKSGEKLATGECLVIAPSEKLKN